MERLGEFTVSGRNADRLQTGTHPALRRRPAMGTSTAPTAPLRQGSATTTTRRPRRGVRKEGDHGEVDTTVYGPVGPEAGHTALVGNLTARTLPS